MIKCRGICQVRKLGSPAYFYSTKSKNVKRCSTCERAFIDLVAHRCPCCNQLLRKKARRPNKKTKLLMVVARY